MSIRRPADDSELTSTTSAAAVHAHFLELRRNVCLGLAENAQELASRLGVVSGEVGERGAFHAGTLEKSWSMSNNHGVDVVLTPVRPIRWM
jgi:hypothetical protein